MSELVPTNAPGKTAEGRRAGRTAEGRRAGRTAEGRRAGRTEYVRVPVTTGWVEPDASRDIDAPMLASDPDVAKWLSVLQFDQRLDLLPRAATQALLGEPVVVVQERGSWVEVRLPWQPTPKDPLGYPAWLPASHIARWPERATSKAFAVVRSRFAPVRRSIDAPPHDVLSMGTILPVAEVDVPSGCALIALGTPSGPLFVESENVTLLADVRRSTTTNAGDSAVMSAAFSMLGVPYLWAGLSGWGVDCSGLVHLAWRSAGQIVSRDSKDMRAEHRVAGGTPAVGEQLFFRYQDERQRIHHVGLAASPDTMLHAPKTGRVVELLPLSEEPYASELERADLG